MAIMLVTGRNAAKAVKEEAERLAERSVVCICRADVAAFISEEEALAAVKGANLAGISGIIFPGSVSWDVSSVAEETGVPCYKGPRNITDLPVVIEKFLSGEIKLSTTLPADVILKKRSGSEVRRELKKAYKRPEKYLFQIGRKNPVYIGAGISWVVAEINDAPLLSCDELEKRAAYLYASGASIIDLGMISGKDNSKKIAGIIDNVRSVADAPLSIDSLNSKEILAAADAGIDLVLSIDSGNCHILDSISVPAVVIPRDAKGKVPAKAEERVSLVEGIIESTGSKKLIADMVLNPVNSGYSESLKAYMLFRERNRETPMMLGAGNVTELLDADSVGVNALLAGFASEQAIDLLFSVEASPKTRGSVRELSTAAEMMYLAKKRGIAPKDLGLDLLILKDKKKSLVDIDPSGIHVAIARKIKAGALEDSSFRIYVDECVNAVYYKRGKPLLRITGGSAEEIYNEILIRGLTKDVFHAAYLGRELSKAENALRLGKEYVQDMDLF